jgi:hypothetical protein
MVSASALSAGMAHGAIIHTYCSPSNPIFTTVPGGPSIYFDLNTNGYADFQVGFNGTYASKPYISDNPGLLSEPSLTPYVLSDATDTGGSSEGLPLTPYGTDIGPSYESQQGEGWFNQNTTPTTIGGWTNSGNNDGYVGLVMSDGGSNVYYGWAHFVYNQTAVLNGVTGTIQLLDYAYESTPNTDILAGQNAEPGTGPAIVNAPAPQSVGIGLSATLSVNATGNPAPTYQWMAGAVGSNVYTNLVDGGGTVGSTSNVLTLSNVSLANQADYVVVVSNIDGTVVNPLPATLTVVPVAIAGLTPSSANLLPGGNASLSVNYSSSVPLSSIQWLKNGAPLSNGGRISGATGSTLSISSVALSDTANYSVALSNTFGSITSVVDSVNVQTSSVPYEEYVSTLSPIEYYRLDELTDPASGSAIAYDAASGLNGVYGTETQNGNPTNNAVTGPLPSEDFVGFSATNTAVSIDSRLIWYPTAVAIPGPDLNTNTASFTAWVYPTASEPDYAVILSYRTPVAGTANGINLASDGSLGYHWNDGINSWSLTTGITVPEDQWSLVAVVISPTNTDLYLFDAAGEQVYNQSVSNAVQVVDNTGHIGQDGNDPSFIGSIDEVSIFNYSLTSLQLTNLWNVAVTGILPPPPPPPAVVLNISKSGGDVIVSWTPAVGTLLQASSLAGPWTPVGGGSPATTPYTNAIAQTQIYYRVKTQ